MSVPTAADGTGHPDLQAAFASTLVDEWVRGGVGHAVVCPGSRSTPLAVALTAHPSMAVHVRLDERSAGFTALGIGRAPGRPALVLTTSGTAAAELHARSGRGRPRDGAPHRLHRRPAAGAPRRGCPPDHRPGPSVRRVGALVLRSRVWPTRRRAPRGGPSPPARWPRPRRGRAGPVPSTSTCPSGSRSSVIRPPEEEWARDGRTGDPGTRWSKGRWPLRPTRCAPWSNPDVSTGGGAGSSWPGPAVAIPTPCSGWPTPWAGRCWPNRARGCASPGRE